MVNLSCIIGQIKLTTLEVSYMKKIEYHHVKLKGELTTTYIINTAFETWRVFSIIDDTCIKTTCLGGGQ